AAADRLDFCGDFYDHAIMGGGLAIAFAAVRRADCFRFVSLRSARLWKCCRPDRLRCVRFQFIESTVGYASSFRHAARARHLFDRSFDLGKNQNRRTVAETGSMDHIWFADRGSVDQRPDRLRILASWPDRLSVTQAKNGPRRCGVRLVTVARAV